MTLRELVFMVLDECKIHSDDSYFNEDHVSFLLSKYRAFLLKKELEKLDTSAKIMVGCQSMCAIGDKRPFVIVNAIPVIEESIEEVIKKVKEML